MESNGYNIIAYADDVAIILQGKYPQTLCDLMENALTILSKWAENCVLDVNPAKTELVLFIRKQDTETSFTRAEWYQVKNQ